VVSTDGTILGIVAGGLSRSSVIAITRPTIDRVAESLSVKGRIARGYIGVAVQPVAIPHSLYADQKTAVIALQVEETGPAGRAGMVIGDVLLALGDHAITGPDVLHAVLDPDSPGKQFDARILRAGAVQQISIVVEERPVRKT
jgi:S1-C subfamily serine protease